MMLTSALSALATIVGAALLAAAPAGARKPLHLAFGDSITAGHGAQGGYPALLGARLQSRWPGLEVRNLAQNGATSAEVLRDQVARAQSVQPVIVTLAIGVNDLTRNVPPAEFARNLGAILDALEARGVPVVVANLPDVSLAPAVPEILRGPVARRVEDMNEALRTVVRGRSVVLADVFTHSRHALPGHRELFGPDGYHPSDLGQRVWADAMWPALLESLGKSPKAPAAR